MLILQTDTTTQFEQFAYADINGKVIVPYGKYDVCLTDTIRTIGFVMKHKEGCVAIDNKGAELFHVYVVDNGNDYPAEGFFRILSNDGAKIGFANISGKVIVSPRYDGALPFSEGMAAVASGTKKVDVSNNEGRYVFTGGKWGFVNSEGSEIIPLEYDSIAPPKLFKNGKIEVLKNGRWLYIDKKNAEVK